MSVVLIPVLLVIFAAAALVLAVVRFQRDRGQQRAALVADPAVLRYTVPEGQDPAVVLAEFAGSDYQVALAPEENVNEVLISSAPGRPPVDREAVRALLTRVRRPSFDSEAEAVLPPVRFADEASG